MRFRNVIQRMRYIRIVSFGSLLLIVVLSSAEYAAEKDAMTLQLGGCGGVYFYASAGELWVEVEKQDLNIIRYLRPIGRLNYLSYRPESHISHGRYRSSLRHGAALLRILRL